MHSGAAWPRLDRCESRPNGQGPTCWKAGEQGPLFEGLLMVGSVPIDLHGLSRGNGPTAEDPTRPPSLVEAGRQAAADFHRIICMVFNATMLMLTAPSRISLCRAIECMKDLSPHVLSHTRAERYLLGVPMSKVLEMFLTGHALSG